MEATKKVGMISKRIVLVSVIMLVAASASANTLEAVLSATKGSLLLVYTIGAMFFFGFLVHVANNKITKGKAGRSLRTANSVSLERRQHHHYRKVIKKTA